MKTNSPRLALVLLGIVSLEACGGYSSGPDGNGALVAGTYTGTVTGTVNGEPLSLQATFALSQSGDAIAGTFSTNAGTSGSISAILSGTTATFTISQTTPCAGTFTGTGTITNSGGRISGSYAGTSPCNGSVSATFVVNRVPGTGPPGY